jgi:hypothetical protein
MQQSINPDKFDKLIRSIKIAVDNDGTLDKALNPIRYLDAFIGFEVLSF